MNEGAKLGLAVIALSLAVGAGAAPRPLLVVVNGSSAGEDVVVDQDAAGRLSMHRRDLVALGVPVPGGGAAELLLAALPGVRASVDEARQVLTIEFAVRDARRNRVSLGTPLDPRPITPSATGVLLNYDITANREGSRTAASGLFEARLFSRYGTLSSSALAGTRRFAGGDRVVRLDTTYSFTDIARLRRYSVGDLISGGLPSTRSVRLGGVQVSTDFSVRPDLITYPVPLLGGSAAVPSTVDILVNGSRVGGGQVAAGDFSVAGTPIINGSGTVAVVLRDALGRETRNSFNIYGVRTLLAPGLKDCTVDAGAVRRNYGLRSSDYRFAAGTATCRIGLSDRLTVEGHAEGASDLALVSGGAVFSLGRFGVASLGVSASTVETGRGSMQGGQVSFGYELIARPVSFNLSVVEATRGYRDIAARAGDAPGRSSILALVGFDLKRLGTLSVGFTRLDGARSLGFRELAFQRRSGGFASNDRRASLATATYTVSLLPRLSLYANALHDFDRGRSTIALLGATLALGPRTSLVGSATFRDGGTDTAVSLNRVVTEPGEFGYRIEANRGAFERELVEARYRSSWGEFSGGVERVNGNFAERAGVRGALVIGGGGILAGNTLNSSFAIVQTGVPGVAVRRDNRAAGVTDGSGRLLVPDLRDFQSNTLTIDPLTLPEDALADRTSLVIRPRDRTGIVSDFRVRQVRAARVRLVDAAGVAIPPGERASLNGGEDVPVGYDGEAFLTGLAAHNEVSVTTGEGTSCRAVFDLAGGATPMVIGPVPCR